MTDYRVTPPPDRLADRVQLRTAFSTQRGTLTRFMIQLEYWLEGDWRAVVRYDHNAAGGHDITEEGLHRDVYRDGEKIRSEDVSPPIPANKGFDAVDRRFTRERRRFHQEGRKMARSERQERPVSDDAFESMPDRFDRVRDLLAEETDDSDA